MAGRLDLEPRSRSEAPADLKSAPAGAAVDAVADARCIAAVLSGSRERFEELIGRYQHIVLGVVRGYVQDADAAEDVAQDIFVSAFTSLHQLRDAALFFPWLLQIARHRAALAGKRRDGEPVRQLPEHAEIAAPPPAANNSQRLHAVFAAVEQLPEPYRETVLLKYEANMSCKEIAERDGVAVGTITSRLTRALLMLRTALGK
jgi:RNA polymerase sigma factor (sigma-70 family)